MTNKHKKTTTNKATKNAKEEQKDPFSAGVPEPQLKNFTRAQVAALVFISIGYTKLMEFSTALQQGTEDPQKCLSYLGADNKETCTHPGFQSLILVKYFSGMTFAAMVTCLALILWSTELTFLKLMNCLTFSPLFATSVAAIFSKHLASKYVWHLLIVASVLFATCAPQNDHQLAFFHVEYPFSKTSTQAITLMGFAAFTLWEIARVVINSDGNMANSLIQTQVPLPEAASTLVNFWIVDKVGIFLLYAFAVVHLPNSSQRVRNWMPNKINVKWIDKLLTLSLLC